MKRRNFLKSALASPFVLALNGASDFGWRPTSVAAAEFPKFKTTGKGVGKNTLLYRYYNMARYNEMIPSFQRGPDCTSHASSLGIETVEAIQCLLKQDNWVGNVASEILHIGGRSVVGNRASGGVAISETMKFIQNYGILFRGKYGDYDFTNYSYDHCKRMGMVIPKFLLKRCSDYKIKTATKVGGWDEARDAIHAFQPVVVGGLVGFDPPNDQNTLTRDKEGFVKPRGEWAHAWLLIGIRDKGRPGGCLMSSHGRNWVTGPKGLKQPDGSIWIEKDLLDKMLSDYGDSYAISNLQPREYKLC